MCKRIVAVILITGLLLFPCDNIARGITNEQNGEVSTAEGNSLYNKLHFYGGNKEYETIDDLDELSNAIDEIAVKDEETTAFSFTEKTKVVDEISVTVEFKSDFMQTKQYIKFSNERKKLNSSEDVLEFRKRLNEYSKEYHSKLVEESVDELSALGYTHMEAIEYSPFVTLKIESDNLNVEDFQMLCESENVEHISLEYEAFPEEEATWNEMLEGINAYDIVKSGMYTGEGVRIGIYESGGVCDITQTNLKDKDITIRDSSVKTSYHATNVTSILATIAPEAKFYVSNVNQVGIAWFISQNCDVVNCSFGYYYNTKKSDGIYTAGVNAYKYSIDAVYDYQIKAHFISVCKSAGNKNIDVTSSKYNPNGEITSPGYAYNVITVGGVTKGYRDSAYRWIHADGACYVSSTPIVKPNVSAAYTVAIPNVAVVSGTSYAAPQVTGSIALLLEKNPSYSGYPEWVMSVITSTAQKTYDYSATIGEFDAKVGAGMINLEGILNNSNYYNKYNYNKNAKVDIYSKSIYLSKGAEIQIALAWLVTADTDVGEVYVTDYDIKVYDSSGKLIKRTYSTKTNVEMLRITATKSDTYRIVIHQYSTQNQNVTVDWMSLTYSCE